MTSTTTAAEHLAKAAEHDQLAHESFQRCDTDGFVTQWAHGVMGQQERLAARIAENGGTSTFLGLFDRATGQRVKAKIVQCKSYQGFGTVSKWIVLDENDKAVAWLPAYKGNSKRSKLYLAGYEERDEQAPAVAELAGSGTGLAGACSVHAVSRRTDGGMPAGAMTPKQIKSLAV